MSLIWNIKNNDVPITSLSDVRTHLLSNRGFNTPLEQEEFLNPPSVQLYLQRFPNEFKVSLQKTRDTILKAVSENRAIVVHGDYDADGICATAILYKCIREELGHTKTYALIPNRFDHGYGLSKASIQEITTRLSKINPKFLENALVITVDSGITSVSEVELLRSQGISVVITDHHQKPQTLPNANAILWSDSVVGSTVAWVLSKALGSKSTESLALAGIATVTDLYPLVGINRAIVKSALAILNSKPPLGIKKLLECAGRPADAEITAYDLGWVIGPRLNASGRITDASDSLLLFLTEDPAKLLQIARDLNDINLQRQDKTLEMFGLATSFDTDSVPKVIVAQNPSFHEGIIGLVAAKLSQTYYRPAIVISTEEEIAKGSVRSIQGINIIEVLRQFEHLFEGLGGHPMAAGFSIKHANIRLLEEALYKYFDENFTDTQLYNKVLDIDMPLSASLLTPSILEVLDVFQPYGLGNSEPKFLTRNLVLTQIDLFGKAEQHIRLRFYDPESTLFHKAILFNFRDTHPAMLQLSLGSTLDIVYKVKKNVFNGNTYLDLWILDYLVK